MEAPSEGATLLTKLVMVFGFYGCLRSVSEIHSIQWNSWKIDDSGYFISYTPAKTRHTSPQPKTFHLPRFEDPLVCPCKMLEDYIKCFPNPPSTGNLLKTCRNGKFITSNIGVNTLSNLGKRVAEFLGLPTPEIYTGHCWRRTSATAFVDTGASLEELKRLGNWKSSAVAERYIADSNLGKRTTSGRFKSAVLDSPAKRVASESPDPPQENLVVPTASDPGHSVIQLQQVFHVSGTGNTIIFQK